MICFRFAVMSSKQILLRMEEDLLEKLHHLHRKEGPMNVRTKKRRPFNVYLRSILAEHASDRMNAIARRASIESMTGDDLE